MPFVIDSPHPTLAPDLLEGRAWSLDRPIWNDSDRRTVVRGPNSPALIASSDPAAGVLPSAPAGYTAPMGAGFLLLASGSDSSASDVALAGPMLLLLVIALVVLALCLAVLTRFARRRLIDSAPTHTPTQFADPWTEAGKRIGQARPGSTSSPPPDDAGGEAQR